MEELARAFSSLKFVSPFYFWIGGAVIIFLVFFPALKAKKNFRWDRGYWIKKVPGLKSKKTWILFFLMAVNSLLIAATFANPQFAEKKSVPFYGNPVMILVDISGSINPHFNGNKQQETFSAFRETSNVYHYIKEKNRGAAIGLSFFSDQNYIARDFAEKPEYLADTIENMDELSEMSMGTMIAEALFDARMYFSDKVEAESKTIILISDLMDGLEEVADQMRQVLDDGINLYVIAIIEDSSYAHQKIQEFKSKIGSGKAEIIWYKDAGEIDKMLEDLSKMKGSLIDQMEVSSQISLAPLILLASLGLTVLLIILSETVFRKIP